MHLFEGSDRKTPSISNLVTFASRLRPPGSYRHSLVMHGLPESHTFYPTRSHCVREITNNRTK